MEAQNAGLQKIASLPVSQIGQYLPIFFQHVFLHHGPRLTCTMITHMTPTAPKDWILMSWALLHSSEALMHSLKVCFDAAKCVHRNAHVTKCQEVI